jgi:CheY-like chemotaxis protein
MDITMPRMDGEDAFEQLRQAGHTMPVVAATGNIGAADKHRMLRKGFDAVLTKPFSAPQLYSVLSVLLPSR